jgi:hypothetical protein
VGNVEEAIEKVIYNDVPARGPARYRRWTVADDDGISVIAKTGEAQ